MKVLGIISLIRVLKWIDLFSQKPSSQFLFFLSLSLSLEKREGDDDDLETASSSFRKIRAVDRDTAKKERLRLPFLLVRRWRKEKEKL
jgi:uncharacterized protein YqhQ